MLCRHELLVTDERAMATLAEVVQWLVAVMTPGALVVHKVYAPVRIDMHIGGPVTQFFKRIMTCKAALVGNHIPGVLPVTGDTLYSPCLVSLCKLRLIYICGIQINAG